MPCTRRLFSTPRQRVLFAVGVALAAPVLLHCGQSYVGEQADAAAPEAGAGAEASLQDARNGATPVPRPSAPTRRSTATRPRHPSTQAWRTVGRPRARRRSRCAATSGARSSMRVGPTRRSRAITGRTNRRSCCGAVTVHGPRQVTSDVHTMEGVVRTRVGQRKGPRNSVSTRVRRSLVFAPRFR